MTVPDIDTRIDELLGTILTLHARPVPDHQPRRLAALLAELRDTRQAARSAALQDLIWAIWSHHADEKADMLMEAANTALAAGDAGLACGILDGLIENWPLWSEAWNKRAIAYFIDHRDIDCLADISRVLDLEPRHFGAIAGFGHICLRHRRIPEARAAFAVAIALNPHLDGLSDLVRQLNARTPVLH